MPISVRGPLTGAPAMRISPALPSSSPAIISSRVLLPQPDGPTSATKRASSTVRSTGPKACTGPAVDR